MRFLLDENLPPSLCTGLSEAGHETTHICQLGLTGATDWEVVNLAQEKHLCIITHDLDFSRIVSPSGLNGPSVVTLRFEKINPKILLNAVLSQIAIIDSLCKDGALITIDEDKI